MFDNYYVGDFPEYGCFRKGENLFWGEGDTPEQIKNLELSGVKERVMCSVVE